MGRIALVIAVAAVGLNAADFAKERLTPDVPRVDAKIDKLGGYEAWADACRWIAASAIPKDARFLTPIDAGSFKWRTGRAEVVARKEAPQDAESIVLWWDRLRDIHGAQGPDPEKRYWHASLSELGADRLKQLAKVYDFDYVLTEAPGVPLPATPLRNKIPAPRLALEELYRNEGYIVYRVHGGRER